jgi:hypothetical protein
MSHGRRAASGAVIAVGRAHWRRRVAALASLALVVALVVAATLAAVAGARRTASAPDRLRAATRTPDVLLQVPDPDDEERVAAVLALPQVLDAAAWSFVLLQPGEGLADTWRGSGRASVDGSYGWDIDQARLVAGRMPDRREPSEILLGPGLAEVLGVEVGDRLPLATLSPERIFEFFGGGRVDFDGPRTDALVTGIGEFTDAVIGANGAPDILLTPAWWEEHRGEVAGFEGQLAVRFHGGVDDTGDFAAAVREIYEGARVNDETGAELSFTFSSEIYAGVDPPIAVQERGLWVVAAVMLVAGLVVVTTSFARHLAGSAADQHVLAAIGFSRRARAAALVVAVLPAAITGAVLGVLGAVVASPLLPMGLARRVEPDPGLSIDPLVLGAGAAVTAAVLAAVIVPSAWGLAGRGGPSARSAATWPTDLARRLRLPPSASAGLAFGFDSRATGSVVAASAAVVAGILGVGGVLTFDAGLDRFLSEPQRHGVGWDLEVGPGDLADDATVQATIADLLADRDVDGLLRVHVNSVEVAGRDEQAFGLETVSGGVDLTAVRGRTPLRPGEVAVGEQTLDRLGVSLGDAVELPGRDGPIELTVVGTTLFPPLERDTMSEGIALALDQHREVRGTDGFPDLLVSVRDGADLASVADRLAEQHPYVAANLRPGEVAHLEQVRQVPRLLVLLLGFVGAAGLVHATIAAIRRRRRDLAVLKSLGFSRRQTGATVSWQVSSLVLAAAVVGLPVGVAAGRLTWSAVASAIGIATDALIPLAVVTVVPASLVIANVIAALPARTAARTPASAVLRAE